jgi:hypothetical protein
MKGTLRNLRTQRHWNKCNTWSGSIISGSAKDSRRSSQMIPLIANKAGGAFFFAVCRPDPTPATPPSASFSHPSARSHNLLKFQIYSTYLKLGHQVLFKGTNQMTVIYLTHCSAKKDDSLQGSGRKVTPDKLYTATPTQRFIQKCKEEEVNWAIFSDKHGVWFPDEKHEWYDKNPDFITGEEFERLRKNFDDRLQEYDKILFYHNPGRFHDLYERLLREVELSDRVELFSHKSEIGSW